MVSSSTMSEPSVGLAAVRVKQQYPGGAEGARGMRAVARPTVRVEAMMTFMSAECKCVCEN